MRTLIFVLLIAVSAHAQTTTVGLTSFSPLKPDKYLPFGNPKATPEITIQKKFIKRRFTYGVGASITKAAYKNRYFSESVILPYAISGYILPIKKTCTINVNAVIGAVLVANQNLIPYDNSLMFGYRFGGNVQADYKIYKRLHVSAICGIYRIKLDNWVTTTQKSAAIGITIK